MDMVFVKSKTIIFFAKSTPSTNCATPASTLTSVSGCEQICSNNAGSFNCDCNEGYVLKADRKTCILGLRDNFDLEEAEAA